MPNSPTVIIPIRNFKGMSRLSPVLDVDGRALLALELCTTAVSAAQAADLRVSVVSSSLTVSGWTASIGAECLPDPGGGLSAAAASAVTSLDGASWIVLHADLPLVDPDSLRAVVESSRRGVVLVPSHDGGTNVIASSGEFPFSYGPGSFHRHFAAEPNATIISSPQLAIDIDTPRQLSAFPELLNLSTLQP